MTIRPAGTNDIPVIQRLAQATWPVCYKTILSTQQLHYMLELIYSPAALQQQFEEGHNFLVLEDDEGKPVGFADYAPKNPGNIKLVKLHKIYLLPHLQGNGYGKLLLQYVIDKCVASQAETLELNVNRHNPAFHFYIKNGFSVDHEADIDIGHGYFMNDYIMQLPLVAKTGGAI